MSKTRELLREGFLDNVFTKNVERPKSILLTTTDLSILTNVYGHLYNLEPRRGLHELLFEQPPTRYSIPPGEINTGDLKAFTWMRYLLSPGAYWKPEGGSAYKDTAYCGGTPLALLGARNKHDVSYNEWHKGINPEDIEQVFKLDVLLGNTLASTFIHADDGTLQWKKGNGLLVYLSSSDDLFNAGSIREIREHSGHSFANYTTKVITSDIKNIGLYNDATPPMRHLFRQTWCWYGKHRSSNMICHWNDWDKVPKDIDDMSVALEGYVPRGVIAPTGWNDIIKGKGYAIKRQD